MTSSIVFYMTRRIPEEVSNNTERSELAQVIHSCSREDDDRVAKEVRNFRAVKGRLRRIGSHVFPSTLTQIPLKVSQRQCTGRGGNALS